MKKRLLRLIKTSAPRSLTILVLVCGYSCSLFAQGIIVTGKVTDEAGGSLSGASVVVKGTTAGVVTDAAGNYSISVPDAGSVLEASFVSFIPKETTVGSRTTIDFVLAENLTELDEVVVTALGIKRAEKALSYNVQKISGTELTAVKDASFMNALAGKVAGVNISSSAAGAGAPVKIVMRGAKSITKDNNAVYVIDGIPMFNRSFGENIGKFSGRMGSEAAADINPEDIENITVLTCPSAAALYGNEGANGVVLITTKRGTAGKTSVTVSNTTTFSSPFIMPKFQNKYGNAQGTAVSWGTEQSAYRYDPSGFFNTGTNTTNSVTLATGNDKSRSYLSAASTNATGILPGSDYDRYNFAYRNTTSFLDDRLTLDAGADFIIQSDKNMTSQGVYFNPLPAVYLFPRGEDFNEIRVYERYDPLREVSVPYWPYGEMGLELTNPYWRANRMLYESNKKRYALSASLQYKITDWIDVTGRAKIDNSYYLNTDKRYAGTPTTLAGNNGFLSKENRTETQFYGDVMANINKKLSDDFNLSAQVGASIKDLRMDDEKVEGRLKHANLFSTENLDRTSGFKINADGYTEQTQSVFANIETSYKGLLFLTLTGRNDWASQLAYSDYSSFFYPSVGLAGVVSEMVSLPEWFSFLKARVSYSSVGTPYNRFMTQFFYSYNEESNAYDAPNTYPIYNLKPELTNSWEAGLNMRFLKGALTIDATWYKSNTLHQTFYAGLPASSGYSRVPVQAGDVQNSGLELAVGYRNTWKNFSWSTNLTYSVNDNKVVRLADGVINPVDGTTIEMPYLDMETLGDTGSPFVRLTNGGSMGDLYVNRALRRDTNGNFYVHPETGKLQAENIEDTKIGSLLAKSNAGWRNTFSWKGVELGIVLSARFGGLVVSGTQAVLDRFGVSERSAELRESGLNINGKAVNPQDWYEVTAAGTGLGAHYVYSATNVRLQELSLSYTLPFKLPGEATKLTLGLVGRNLAMIYCKAPFDPELTPSSTSTFYSGVDYFMQPSLRNIGFNVKLQF